MINIFESYADAGQQLPQRDKERFYTALIEFIGYGMEPDLDGAAGAVFTAIRPSLEKSKKRAEAGRKGGQASSKNGICSDFATEQKASKKQASEEANGQPIKITSTTTYNPKGVGGTGGGDDPFGYADTADVGFPWECLAAFNDAVGATYSSMPAKCTRTLERFDGKYGLDDVRRMVEYKRDEWRGTGMERHLTPNTLFSPDHFEQYMQQSSKEASKDARFDKYR